MTSLSIRFEAAAKRELFEAMEWYEARDDGLGNRFLGAARVAVERAATKPLIFAELKEHEGVRRVIFDGFPYMAVFTVRDGILWVVAIAHQKRGMRFWQTRLSRRRE